MKVVKIKMSNSIFNEKEIQILSQNKYVKKVSSKAITYTDEFKRIFIAENERGKAPTQIFSDHGLTVDILGISRIKSSGKRWRASYRKEGVSGLQDTRSTNSGRPRTKDLSIEEKYERLTAQNRLLKAENELLKKIDLMERRLIKKK